jgi:anaerobic magnesium-protoporphyrin IX monomethyl ester cyclase
MKILLATAPDEDSPWNQASFPPLGLLYLIAGVKRLPGMHVELVDVYAEGLTQSQAAERILRGSPDIVGITTTSGNVPETCELLTAIKSECPNILTVAGGVHATVFDDLMLRELPALDFVIRGEADHSFPELCRRLAAGEDVHGLPGLSHRSNGEIVRGEPQLILDLDDVPFPDRSLMDNGLYGAQWYGYRFPFLAGRVTTASSSRGCPFKCSFCSMVKMCSTRFRARSAANVFRELQMIHAQGFEFVIFWDDNFSVDIARVQALCHMLLDSHLGLRFGFAGTLHLLPESTLKLMQRAGFDITFVGVESGSDSVLAYYRKPARRRALASGILKAKDANMFTIASFIAGAPNEAPGDFQDTVEFVLQVRPHVAEINPLMVHPGSRLWEEFRGEGSPATLEASRNRPIWRFTEQIKKETVEDWMREFKRAFIRTYWHSAPNFLKRIAEFIRMLIHNQTIRKGAGMLLTHTEIVRQFFRMRLR